MESHKTCMVLYHSAASLPMATKAADLPRLFQSPPGNSRFVGSPLVAKESTARSGIGRARAGRRTPATRGLCRPQSTPIDPNQL